MTERTFTCRVCREETPRLSRLCLRCQTKQRQKRNVAVQHPRPASDIAYLVRELPDADAIEVVRWFADSRRTAQRDEVLASAPTMRPRCMKYGITVAQWALLVVRQRGACAICAKSMPPTALVIDHDHATGKVRGLLCTPCNTGLGLLGIDGPGSRSRAESVSAYICAASDQRRQLRTVQRDERHRLTYVTEAEFAEMVESFSTIPGTETMPVTMEEWLRQAGVRLESERPDTK